VTAERPRSTPPGGWLRRAGIGHSVDGAQILWSIAEGSRGRRWRATSSRDGTVESSLLLEATAGGRILRLEYTTASGMLTLHPERDERSIHGNIVHPHGVRPVAITWSLDYSLEVAGSLIPTAIALARLARSVHVGEGETIPVVAVDPSLGLRPGTRLVRRIAERRWVVADLADRHEIDVELDEDGVPRLEAARTWPLEI